MLSPDASSVNETSNAVSCGSESASSSLIELRAWHSHALRLITGPSTYVRGVRDARKVEAISPEPG
jgi:hypothetical protein